MTVADLISRLSKCDPSVEVKTDDGSTVCAVIASIDPIVNAREGIMLFRGEALTHTYNANGFTAIQGLIAGALASL